MCITNEILLTDSFLAYVYLQDAPHVHKLTGERLMKEIAGALEAGKKSAAFLGGDIEQICREYGIVVKRVKGDSSFAGVSLRAQLTMHRSGAEITVYDAAVEKMKGYCPDIYDAVLCHDMFHYMQEKHVLPFAYQCPQIQERVLGLFDRKVTLSVFEEVAAHAFAKAFLHTAYLPVYYDYLYMIDQKMLTQENWEKKLQVLYKEYQKLSVEKEID